MLHAETPRVSYCDRSCSLTYFNGGIFAQGNTPVVWAETATGGCAHNAVQEIFGGEAEVVRKQAGGVVLPRRRVCRAFDTAAKIAGCATTNLASAVLFESANSRNLTCMVVFWNQDERNESCYYMPPIDLQWHTPPSHFAPVQLAGPNKYILNKCCIFPLVYIRARR